MEQAQLYRDTLRRLDATRPGKTLRTKAWVVALSTLAITGTTLACSGVGPPGKPVVFGDQTNIVIWDEARHVEHFIRNANFKSGADNFGFIAPTPGEPHLNQASTQAFYTLASLAPVFSYGSGGGGFGGGGGGVSRSDQVKVIQEADVSGYHATTLWSKNAGAINDWMNEHGYISTPEVEKWAERYCERGWYLTAFKVIDLKKLAASTGTVRMTFKTDKPFNPFYVPSSNIPINGGGTLRVYFVSVGNYDANIGTTGTWQVPQWTAPIPEMTAEQLAKQVELPSVSIPKNSQVETFVDNNFPRPAPDDIYFVKRKVVEAPPAKPILKPQGGGFIPPFVFPSLFLGLGLVGVASRRRPNG